MDLMGLMTGFGLASGAGGRASLVALLLGVFHHTEYFELATQFDWLASPPVMGVLAVIALLEIWVDAHPDMSGLSEIPTYFTSFIVGFIALSASTGSVDSNLLELVGSGVFGGGTALGIRYVRSEVSSFVNIMGEGIDGTVGEGTTNKARSWMENGITVGIATTSVLIPFVAIGAVVLFVIIGLLFVMSKKTANPAIENENNDDSAHLESQDAAE